MTASSRRRKEAVATRRPAAASQWRSFVEERKKDLPSLLPAPFCSLPPPPHQLKKKNSKLTLFRSLSRSHRPVNFIRATWPKLRIVSSPKNPCNQAYSPSFIHRLSAGNSIMPSPRILPMSSSVMSNPPPTATSSNNPETPYRSLLLGLSNCCSPPLHNTIHLYSVVQEWTATKLHLLRLTLHKRARSFHPRLPVLRVAHNNHTKLRQRQGLALLRVDHGL